MTDPAVPRAAAIDRIAVVRPEDGTVFGIAAGRAGSAELPELVTEGGWPDIAALSAAVGCPLLPIGPSVQVSREPRVALHVAHGRPTVPGRWVAFHELAEHGEVLAERSAQWTGRRPRPPLRPDWYRASWLAEVDGWVDGCLAGFGVDRAGSTELVGMWSLSAVLRVPCVDRPRYVKAACRHFHAEPAVTALLGEWAPRDVTTVLALDPDRAWMLMDPLPGPADDDPRAMLAAAAALARVQLGALDRLEALLETGCPDRSLGRTGEQFAALLDGSPETADVAAVRVDLPRLRALLGELDGCGLPTTLGHGDLHLGNVAWDAPRAVLYDWTDACLTHPVLDLCHLTARAPEDARAAAVAAYGALWQERFPDADLVRAMTLAPTADRLFQAVSYDTLGHSVEPAARWQVGGMVAGILQELAGSEQA